jgi:3-oxoacyl-[acyl-carrier protein] reductase
VDNEKSLKDICSLAGKTVVITGAAAGIGRAIAYRFAEARAGLILVDIDGNGLKKIQDDLSCFDCRMDLYEFDLSSTPNITRLWDELKGVKVDILVNNVGIYPPADFINLEPVVWQKVLDTNLISAMEMSRRMIGANLDRGGVIINLGSIEAILPFADDLIHYDITKAGVIALTRGLAKKYGKKGFRVNALLPGGIDTQGTREVAKRIATKFDIGLIGSGIKYQVRIPMSRRGKPDEVALAALFLASDMASYITGALIPVDGGFLSS